MLLIVIMLSAVIFDLQTFRIPNRLIIVGIAAGELRLLYRMLFIKASEGMLRGAAGILTETFLAVAMLFLLYPLWKVRCIGGGDVKLCGMSVLYIGFVRSIGVLILACVIGLFLAGLKNLGHMVFPQLISGLKKEDRLHVMHFSLPMLLAVITEMLWGDTLYTILTQMN